MASAARDERRRLPMKLTVAISIFAVIDVIGILLICHFLGLI